MQILAYSTKIIENEVDAKNIAKEEHNLPN